MRRLFSRTRFVAPFLFSERGSVQLTRALRSAGGGATEFGEDQSQYKLQLSGEHKSCVLDGKLFSDCSSHKLVLDDLKLERATWKRSLLRSAQITQTTASRSWWDVVDLENAAISESNFEQAQFNLVSLRDARLKDVNFRGARFVLCDFSGAHFRSVDFTEAQFVGCDFEGCVFESDVNFAGADLSGNHLQRTWLGGATFEGTRLQDCDLRASLGLADGAALIRAGATYRPSLLGRFFERILGAQAGQHRRVLTAVSVTWACLALLLPALFFARAIMNPINPDEIPLTEEFGNDSNEEEHQND